MSKAHAVRSSDILYDGGPLVLTARMTNAASEVIGVAVVLPCDMWIHSFHYRITTQFTHANSRLNVGATSDTDAYIDSINIQNDATGYYEHDMTDATVVSDGPIPKGTAVTLGLDAADTTGVVVATLVLVPYDPRG